MTLTTFQQDGLWVWQLHYEQRIIGESPAKFLTEKDAEQDGETHKAIFASFLK